MESVDVGERMASSPHRSAAVKFIKLLIQAVHRRTSIEKNYLCFGS